MVYFHDPRASTAVQPEPYRLGVDLARMNDPCIAFLANGFPDSERFLDKVAKAMERILPRLTQYACNKGDASSPAPPAMIEEIHRRCHAAIAAYGH